MRFGTYFILVGFLLNIALPDLVVLGRDENMNEDKGKGEGDSLRALATDGKGRDAYAIFISEDEAAELRQAASEKKVEVLKRRARQPNLKPKTEA